MTTSHAIPGLSFTAIDFETANGSRASACSVGVAKVRDGQVVDTWSQLIAPPEGHDVFHDMNIAIHGITPDMITSAPRWPDVFPQVMAFVGGDDLVAHNAPFDKSVFTQSCSLCDIDWPENPWYDTIALAKPVLTLASYRLDVVSQHLGLPDFEHHQAEADAVQAALIAIALNTQTGTGTLAGLFDHGRALTFQNMAAARPSGNSSRSRSRNNYSQLVGADPLTGENVVFTGTLNTLTRAEASSLVSEAGGTVQKGVTKKTTIVVAGDFDPARLRPGATLSSKLETARKYAESGQRLEILTEADLFTRIEVTRESIEQATREHRAASNTGWTPAYVVHQAREADPGLDYNAWLRQSLRHPDGRTDSADCIRCTVVIDQDTHWVYRERRVCSADCNEALKRGAKRAWHNANVSRPAPPSYDQTWALRRPSSFNVL